MLPENPAKRRAFGYPSRVLKMDFEGIEKGLQPHFEPLEKGFFAAVDSSHRFCADAFMLADFADAENASRAADLCCGCGIIALLLAKNNPALHITAVDIDSAACGLAELSAEKSGCAGRIEVINADIRLFSPADKYDLVTVNPPFFSSGRTAADPMRAAARHTLCCEISDAVAAARRCLSENGRLAVCVRPQSRGELLAAFAQNGLAASRLRLCCDRPSAAPFLLLAEATKNAENTAELPPLCVKDECGELTDEYKKLYGGYYL